jgi:hypothetical protein
MTEASKLIWRRGVFDVEDYFEPGLKGVTADQHWNGWSVPAFEKADALHIAKVFGDMEYSADKDAFICDMGHEGEPPEEFTGFDINLDGETLHVYAIGSGFWVWSEISEADHPQ